MERHGDIFPLCANTDLKVKEATTRSLPSCLPRFIYKELKRKVLKEVTEYTKVFDKLGAVHSYSNIIDNIVDGFWMV